MSPAWTSWMGTVPSGPVIAVFSASAFSGPTAVTRHVRRADSTGAVSVTRQMSSFCT